MKPKKHIVKFDAGGFFFGLGIGIGCSAVGILFIWATLTAPAGSSNSTPFTTTQRLVHLMPESVKGYLAMAPGVLFVLFGLFTIGMSFKLVVQYLINKIKKT